MAPVSTARPVLPQRPVTRPYERGLEIHTMERRSPFGALRVAPLALALLGCPPAIDGPSTDPTPAPDGDPGAPSNASLVQVGACDDLQEYVVDAWVESLVQSRYGYGWGWLAEDTATDGAPNSGESPDEYSETNVQEQGVDEPDLTKTDGEYIYVAQRGELTIVDSWPAEETHKVASLPIEGNPFSLFLRDDRALVFSYDWDLTDDGAASELRYGQSTRLTIVDVSDRTNPAVLREIDLEGWFTNARMIGGDVYVVMQTWTDMPYELWDLLWNGQIGLPEANWEAPELVQAVIRAQARAILRPYVEQAVGLAGPDAVLPHIVDRAPGEPGTLEPVLSCADMWRPEGLSRPSVLSLLHLDLDEGTAGGSVTGEGLLADGWTVYASQDHLFIAQTSWWWWWGWGDLDLNTHIHEFSLDGEGSTYLASGEVDGWVLNQFSMGEYDGFLRVATTDTDWWWGVAQTDVNEPANNVFVLEQEGTSLSVVGEIGGIAPGERIFSARFQGERGYLVTFEQTDPLFTLDLSDPTAPTVVGMLEVTGFSSYLHPVGDDRLLSVGMEADVNGQTTGLAVSMFDVSDFANPSLLDRYVITTGDWSWSEALWDHHAFTYFDGVLTIPMYSYEWDSNDYNGFSGLLMLDVDLETGFTELGRIDHSDMVNESECIWYWGSNSTEASMPCGDSWWYASMRRGIVIEDTIYSLSDYGLRVNELRAPENEFASVVFWPLDE